MKLQNRAALFAIACMLGVACGGDDTDSNFDPVTPITPIANTTQDAAKPAADAGAVKADAGKTDAGRAMDDGDDDMDAAVVAPKPDAATVVPPRPDAGKPDAAIVSTPDAALPSSGDAVLALCSSCADTNCKAVDFELGDPLQDVTAYCSKLSGNASDGPGVGKPRTELCNALLECAHKNSCHERGPLACLCGDLPFAKCQEAKVSDLKGACVKAVFAAAETTEVQRALELFADPTFALGGASELLRCEYSTCADECFAPCKGQADGASCSDAEPCGGEILCPPACQAGSCPDKNYP